MQHIFEQLAYGNRERDTLVGWVNAATPREFLWPTCIAKDVAGWPHTFPKYLIPRVLVSQDNIPSNEDKFEIYNALHLQYPQRSWPTRYSPLVHPFSITHAITRKQCCHLLRAADLLEKSHLLDSLSPQLQLTSRIPGMMGSTHAPPL